MLNAINEIGIEGRKLKRTEYFEYKSKAGNAKVGSASSINMSKILYELGGETIEQQRIEILKVKSLDLLSDRASWKLIRLGKSIDVKISDKKWLEDYHKRNVIIQPNDYLKLELKITYITSSTTLKPNVYYEAVKIYKVIPPNEFDNDNQGNLFTT